VVDQAKKALGRTIEVSVTSVLQTTAGKMIFCRWPEAAAFVEEPRRDSRLGDRRDLVRNGRDPRIPDRRETERRDGERPGGLAPIPPSATPGALATAIASSSSADDRAPEPPHEAGGGAAALPHGLIDRPAAKAE
jgi:hypothetical protein